MSSFSCFIFISTHAGTEKLINIHLLEEYRCYIMVRAIGHQLKVLGSIPSSYSLISIGILLENRDSNMLSSEYGVFSYINEKFISIIIIVIIKIVHIDIGQTSI